MKKEKIAKVGDKIRIVNAEVAVGFYENGDILEVVGVDEYPSGVEVLVADDQHFLVYHTEYEIVEDGKEDDFVFTKEHVGMEVWDVMYGKGEVVNIASRLGTMYPVEVCFDKSQDEGVWFTLGGKYYEDCNRTLFFSEPKIIAETKPPKKPFVPTLKKGTDVLIKSKYAAEPTVWVVDSETEDRIYTSNGERYYMKQDIEYVRVLGEQVKFS